VVGFSRLTGSDEEGTLARLRTLWSDLIAPTISVHNGRVVKRTGDGSIIEFRSVVDAVRCAIEVQNGMVDRNAGLPSERRIEFRFAFIYVVEESDGARAVAVGRVFYSYQVSKRRPLNATYGVEIRPRLVATTHRSPHRTMDSTRPTPGTVSPRLAVKIPFGPSKTAAPLFTSRSIHPSMVVHFVSGTGIGIRFS
jgi:hypothetical protein